MAERIPAVFVSAALGCRKYKTAVFNGTAADEDMPMGFAGLFCESRRNCQHGCASFGERAVKRGKTQVIANGQTEAAPRQIGQYRQLPRTVVARLAIALAAGQIDVEHMDLVVAREDVALRIDQERTIGGAIGRYPDRKGTDVHVDAELTRDLAQRGQRWVCLFFDGHSEKLLAIGRQDI